MILKSRENQDIRNGGSKVEINGAAEAELHQSFPILVIIARVRILLAQMRPTLFVTAVKASSHFMIGQD